MVLILRDQLATANTEISSLKSHLAEALVQIATLHSQVISLQSQVASLLKNSSNSSKPPSSDMPGSDGNNDKNNSSHNRNSRNPSGKKPGGQQGHLGINRPYSTIPDKTVRCTPNQCSHSACALSLETITAIATEKTVSISQVTDIPPIEPVVTEYQLVSRTCSNGHITVGTLPDFVTTTGTVQVGPNASSLLVYLNTVHHIPYGRLQLVASDLFGLKLSQGTIKNKLEIAYLSSKPLATSILRYLITSKWVGSDETGCRVAGLRIWQWVWQNRGANLYKISKHRDYQTVKDNFGEKFTGCLIHDCYSAQNNSAAGNHQLCHAHLLRDLQYLIDQDLNCFWARKMQLLLLKSQRARDHIWQEGFNPDIRNKVIASYSSRLQNMAGRHITKLTSKEAITLQKRFNKHESKILHFMTDPDIPPDNNGSERAIRQAKIKQKVSGGFRSMQGAEVHASILSVIETAKKQGLNVLDTIRAMMSGQVVNLFGDQDTTMNTTAAQVAI
jgi:transposase